MSVDISRMIGKALEPVKSRLRGIVRRAVLGGLAVSSKGSTTFQASSTKDDTDDEVELLQAHGFWSTPPDGSEGVVLCVGGSRSCRVGVCFGSRDGKPAGLAAGDTAVYNETGAVLILRSNGSIELTPANGNTIVLGTPEAATGKGVARMLDPVMAAPAMLTWISQVTAICSSPAIVALAAGPPAPVAPSDFGTIEQGSSVTFSE